MNHRDTETQRRKSAKKRNGFLMAASLASVPEAGQECPAYRKTRGLVGETLLSRPFGNRILLCVYFFSVSLWLDSNFPSALRAVPWPPAPTCFRDDRG